MDIKYINIDEHATININTIKNIPQYTYQWFMENDKEVLYALDGGGDCQE